MTIKKTVQMIALSGVLAIGVSGNAMAVADYTTADYLWMAKNPPASASDEYRQAFAFASSTNWYSKRMQEQIDQGIEVKKAKEIRDNLLIIKNFADQKLAQYHPATKESGNQVVPKGDIVTFKEEVTAVDGTTIEKTLDDIANEQRDIAAIHNALAGIHYVFGKEDKYSMSGSVGFHNASNVALAIGISAKPRDNVMIHGSLSSSASMENFGANVGVSIAF